MDAGQVAGTLLIIGSAVFFVGATTSVPKVFMEPDPQARLRMLEDHRRLWKAAQPFFALGALIAAAGVGVLAAHAPGGLPSVAILTSGRQPSLNTRPLLEVACGLLVVGALAWSWSVYVRGTRVREFALGQLPGWPFVAYVLLTILGLALLGIGLLIGGYPAWLGWLTLAADAFFLAVYLATKDLPPFVFYVLLLIVGGALV